MAKVEIKATKRGHKSSLNAKFIYFTSLFLNKTVTSLPIENKTLWKVFPKRLCLLVSRKIKIKEYLFAGVPIIFSVYVEEILKLCPKCVYMTQPSRYVSLPSYTPLLPEQVLGSTTHPIFDCVGPESPITRPGYCNVGGPRSNTRQHKTLDRRCTTAGRQHRSIVGSG